MSIFEILFLQTRVNNVYYFHTLYALETMIFLKKFKFRNFILYYFLLLSTSVLCGFMALNFQPCAQVEVVGSGFEAKSIWKSMIGSSEFSISGGPSISHQLSAKPGIAGAVEQAFSGKMISSVQGTGTALMIVTSLLFVCFANQIDT